MYEKLINMLKLVNMTMVEYFEHTQRRVPELTIFRGYHVKTFSDGSQDFSFVHQQNQFSKEQVMFLEEV